MDKKMGGTSSDSLTGIATDAVNRVYVSGSFVNNISNTNLVLDFDGVTFAGKTATASSDGFLLKIP